MSGSVIFGLVILAVFLVPVLRSFRAHRDPGAPSGAVQLLLLLGVLGLCSALTYAAWWQSGQGTGLSTDLAAAVGGDQGGRGGVLVGTSVRHGSRRGRTHRGRGLHGGK
jgi:hypothetical protein